MLTFVNDFATAYFGKSRELLVGEGWQNVLHASDLPVAVETWTKAVATGEPYEADFRLLRAADRTYRWHRPSGRLVKGPDGQFWLGSNLDIDAERRGTEMMDAWREQTRRAFNVIPGSS